jgi:plastocyanin
VRARKAVLGGLIVVMLLGLAGCGGNGGKDKGLLGGAGTASLVVHDTMPFYDPGSLEIPLNKDIVFTVYNDGKKVHNITIPGFGVDVDMQPGQSVEIKLPAINAAPRDGFYTMYCKYHQSEGEQSRITVSR